MSAPDAWKPCEAYVTLNDNWGYHAGDDNWKSPKEIIKLLCKASSGRGNLLLNIGLTGDGAIPVEASAIIESVGEWKHACGEGLEKTDLFDFGLEKRANHRGDWHHHGPMTASGNNLYLILTSWPGKEWTFSGLEQKVMSVEILPDNRPIEFRQDGECLHFRGLPEHLAKEQLAPVIKLRCDAPPSVYNCGGMRIPNVPHPPYDPLPSDIAH